MHMNFKKLSSIVALLLLVFTFSACESEGPAENAGEKIDQTVEQTVDKAKEAGEALGDKAKEAGDKVEKATD